MPRPLGSVDVWGTDSATAFACPENKELKVFVYLASCKNAVLPLMGRLNPLMSEQLDEVLSVTP